MVATGAIEYRNSVKNIIGRRIIHAATYGKECYVNYDKYAKQILLVYINIMYIKK